MRRKLLVSAFFTLFAFCSHAQIYDPVTWSFRSEKVGENKYELIFSAAIESGSHIYSMNLPDGGPIPTTITVDSLPDYSLDGKPFEVTTPEEVFDDAFGFRIKIFNDKAEFRQKITSKSPSFTVKGKIEFMSCNNSTCSPPQDREFEIHVGKVLTEAPAQPKKGILSFFLFSFLLGLLGVITPCVYPMIPMTIAFFSRGAEQKSKGLVNALIFGISIVIIYTSPGLIISLTGAGAGFANALSTHWIPNIIFFLLFVIFAVSFLGAFELTLPNKWAAGADSKVDKGGMLAAFFMALTTVIISFSCTGPIVGSLLVEAARGDVIRPTVGMFAFGLAFALPFTLFALFPALLSKLPKSGGWLNSIKVVLAFLMLAFSLKFVMTIDSVYSLGLLSRELFLSVWIVLFSLLGLYLMGKIRFSHDSEVTSIGPFRFFLIIAVFTFVLYLFTGLFGAPLKGIASLIPVQESRQTSLVNSSEITQPVSVPFANAAKLSALCSEPKYNDRFSMPLGLQGYFDYSQGLKCAKEQGKPVLLDFKGHACANCKLMESRVWSDPEVLKLLKEEFVIVSLYCDDRTELPESEWVKSTTDGRMKKTIGKVNEDLEISRFSTNALPYYVIAGYDGNALITPSPTNLNVAEYRKWLEDGLRAFKEKN